MTAEDFLSHYEYLKVYSHIQHREKFEHSKTINKTNVNIHSGQWNLKGREGEYSVHFNSMGKTSGCGYAEDPGQALSNMSSHEKALERITSLLRNAGAEVKNEPTQLTIGGI